MALLLAAIGEMLVESRNRSPLSLILYLAGIGLLVATTVDRSARRSDPAVGGNIFDFVAPPLSRSSRRFGSKSLAIGICGALVLDALALLLLRTDIRSAGGTACWIAAVLVLIVTGILGHPQEGWQSKWGSGHWPALRRNQVLILMALVGIVVIGAAARLLFLDAIPLGINADEGDRGAVAIQVIRGQTERGIWESGWYHISMMYFWLLAQVMKVAGISYVGARVFGALASVLALATVVWIGVRHFSLRVGLLAGAITAVMAVTLQFARETSEAGPTGTLWAISAALFLEAARRGRSWAWIGAGTAGAFAIYFYPASRLWPLLAALICTYLFLRSPREQRAGIALGTTLAAIAALVVATPFFVTAAHDPYVLAGRAQDTSIFTNANFTRLNYYQPTWGLPGLLVEQVVRSVGLFNQFADAGGFWPTDRPIMSGLLAVSTLLGLGWVSLSWRDHRMVLIALWFWVGLISLVVTVETPNLQRLGTAIPSLGLFSALFLDELAGRAEQVWKPRKETTLRISRWLIASLLTVLVSVILLQEVRFYFEWYRTVERWPVPTLEGRAINALGSDTQVYALGPSFFHINSGWVRLMAPFTPRAGLKSPGSYLPLTRPASSKLAFAIFPRQLYYLPYLKELYPGGVTQEIRDREGSLVLVLYQLSQDQWVATQGAMAQPPTGPSVRVAQLGVPPTNWNQYPSPMRWTAGWRVEEDWNYTIEIGPGPARLSIDDQEVLTVPAGARSATATLWLARGDHALVFDGVLDEVGRPARFRWAPTTSVSPSAPVESPDREAPTEQLIAGQDRPMGLSAVAQVQDRPLQGRLDKAVATCCVQQQLRADGRPFSVFWQGMLLVPTTGEYGMRLWTTGSVRLVIDGVEVIQGQPQPDATTMTPVMLQAGSHSVELRLESNGQETGLEWIWAPPGEPPSIIPPSALVPLNGAGVTAARSPESLGRRDQHLAENPFETVP